jgi:hypothetical protein
MGKNSNKNKQQQKQVPKFPAGGAVPGKQELKAPAGEEMPEAISPLERLKEMAITPDKNVPGNVPTDEQIKDYQDAENKATKDRPVPVLQGEWGFLPNKSYGPIPKEQWQQAQAAERTFHTMGYGEGIMHYHNSYRNYFELVGLGFDLGGMTVIEVGPADFPALYFCENMNGVVVEPMESEHLKRICEHKNIQLIKKMLEEIDGEEIIALQVSHNALTEVWLFNVMQHIADPESFVMKAKMLADRIRFFEPINRPAETHHPQSYTLEDFKRWFGDCVQYYHGGDSRPGFHTAECAYGVWICPE